MENERNVAGMRCGEVLAELSDYLDGEMAPGRLAQVVAHLQGCDACERFGGAFTAALHSLRHLEPGDAGDGAPAFERLRTCLERATRREPPEAGG